MVNLKQFRLRVRCSARGENCGDGHQFQFADVIAPAAGRGKPAATSALRGVRRVSAAEPRRVRRPA